MKVLLVHNRYQQPGGEDAVFEAERDLLRSRGHQVVVYERHNAEIADYSVLRRAGLPRQAIWSDAFFELKELVGQERPGVAHFHNTFPLVSPAGYYACKAFAVPVVQTLHNYRLLCPGALLFRRGRVCEDCLGRAAPWPGVLHRCYRGSLAQSAAAAAMLSLHRWYRTFHHAVDAYIALTAHGRVTFIRGGLPANLIYIKPNFLPEEPLPAQGPGEGALFAGRLSQEKGAALLLTAWQQLPEKPLRMLGDGPLRKELESLGRACPGVTWGGWVSIEALRRAIATAAFVALPSLWYEGHPMLLLQAYASGRPVLASRGGGLADLVRHGETGLLFEPGDASDLAAKARELLDHPEETARMGRAAHKMYQRKYTPQRNYQRLMEIYDAAMQRVMGAVPPAIS